MDYSQKLLKIVARDARQVGIGSFEASLGLPQLSQVQAILIKSVTFNNNKYNVVAGVSDTFGFSADGGPFTVVLDPGFYTAAAILAILNPAVTAIVGGVTASATWNAVILPNSFRISATATLVTMDYGADSLNYSLGLTSPAAGIPPATPYIFPSLPALMGLHAAQIAVSSKSPRTVINLPGQQGRYTNAIDLIPVNVPFGYQQTFLQPDFEARLWYSEPEDFTTVTMTIRDENGDPLPDQADHLIIELVAWV